MTKRSDILNAARKLFLEKGYEKTSMRQIVKEAGSSIGSCYFYFKNKEEIFSSLAANYMGQLWEKVANRINEIPEPCLRVSVAIYYHFYHILENDNWMKLYLMANSLPSLKQSLLQNFYSSIQSVSDGDEHLQRKRPLHLSAIALTGALSSVVEEKLKGGLESSAEELSVFMTELSLYTLGYEKGVLDSCLKFIDRRN